METHLPLVCYACGSKRYGDGDFDQSESCRAGQVAHLTTELAAARAKAEKLDEANTPFEDAEPEIKITRHELGWYEYQARGGITGPYKTWREAYRAAEGYLDWVREKQRADELTAAHEATKRELAEVTRQRDDFKEKYCQSMEQHGFKREDVT